MRQGSTKLIKLILVLLLAILGGVLMWHMLSSYTDRPTPVASPHEILTVNKTEAILAKWVYNHSNKISRNAADALVKAILKTDHPLLILSIVLVESDFVPSAVSTAGCVGYGQVNWKVWSQDLIKVGIAKEKRDLFDLETNIKATNYILDYCLKQGQGDIAKSLSLYLGGKDGWYKNRITENLANLYILVNTQTEQTVEKAKIELK